MDATEPAPHTAPAGTKKKKGGIGESTRFLFLLFLFAVLLRSFIVAPFMIPSGSMLPRMMIGDYLFVAKWPYGFSRYSFPFSPDLFSGRLLGAQPKRGDIIIFHYPGPGDEDYVKRLIGLPGDTVQMRAGRLILNGTPVPKVRRADYLMPKTPNSPCRYADPSALRPVLAVGGREYCAYPRYRETLPGGRSYDILDQLPDADGDETKIYHVPPGHYFMMGDNRDDSFDSRFAQEVGGVDMLPADHLIGKALFIFFSTDGSAEWLQPWTWFTAARWDRIVARY